MEIEIETLEEMMARGEIIPKARMIQEEITFEFAEMETYFAKRR
ncbi:MAG: hypothetical protein QME12_03190 [Nanoarchaeota archaeon]|nr:hypothetical protein [Nanoarchaeota archaeon]